MAKTRRIVKAWHFYYYLREPGTQKLDQLSLQFVPLSQNPSMLFRGSCPSRHRFRWLAKRCPLPRWQAQFPIAIKRSTRSKINVRKMQASVLGSPSSMAPALCAPFQISFFRIAGFLSFLDFLVLASLSGRRRQIAWVYPPAGWARTWPWPAAQRRRIGGVEILLKLPL